jgi:hypothetical protein
VAEIVMGPREVTVKIYATDERGRYAVDADLVPVQDLGEKEPTFVRGGGSHAAMHTISIPFVGGWEKPVCMSKRDLARGDGTTPICDLVAGHAGEHATGEFRWGNLSGLAAAGVLCESAQREQIGSAKYRMACDRFEGHDGEHHFGRNTGRIIGDSPQA